MPYHFSDPIHYHLIKSGQISNPVHDFNKIIDYLLTFVGDIGVTKEREGKAVISYTNTPLVATLQTDSDPALKETIVSQQITLTCEKSDMVSVHLIKNVTNSIGYRIFNPNTLSYLVNDPHILDLTSVTLTPRILEIMQKMYLTPFLQYRDSLVFFAKDPDGHIHLINRHALEYLNNQPTIQATKIVFSKDDFSLVVATDIGRFVALFDRGLIPISFYSYRSSPKKISNLSGFDLGRLIEDIVVYPIFFSLDISSQAFTQIELPNYPHQIKLTKGQSLVSIFEKMLKNRPYLRIKIAQDVDFVVEKNKLTPKLGVLVFLDS